MFQIRHLVSKLTYKLHVPSPPPQHHFSSLGFSLDPSERAVVGRVHISRLCTFCFRNKTHHKTRNNDPRIARLHCSWSFEESSKISSFVLSLLLSLCLCLCVPVSLPGCRCCNTKRKRRSPSQTNKTSNQTNKKERRSNKTLKCRPIRAIPPTYLLTIIISNNN